MSPKTFGTKQCPQCGAMMEKITFTPKKGTGKVYQGGKGHGSSLGSKKSGPTKTWWQCPEDFNHTVEA